MTTPIEHSDASSDTDNATLISASAVPAGSSRAGQNGVQFDMRSLFWLTATASIALMYLRPIGIQAVGTAMAIITVAGISGWLIGSLRGRPSAAIYWAVLGGSFAYISTVTGHLAHWTTPLAWAALGVVTGSVAGACATAATWRCMVSSALVAGITMAAYTSALYWFTGLGAWFDLACSVPIGALFGLLARILASLQQRSAMRYDAVATLLMAAIVVGNYLSRFVAPIMIAIILVSSSTGCSSSPPPPTADSAPFEAAIEQYLAQNGMELRLKTILEGPAVEGEQAQMTASLNHRELGGPSIVWILQFQRGAGLNWTVKSHKVK